MDEKRFLLAQIVENIPHGILICELSGEIVYVNKRCLRMLGYKKDELVKQHLDNIFFDVEKRNDFECVKQSVINSPNRYYTFETTVICQGAVAILYVVDAFCIYKTDKSPHHVVCIFRDVSQEKAMTQELETKHVELQKANSKLIQSNQELKRVSELKTKFLSIASHELKTPLTSIKGYSEIILDTFVDKLDPVILPLMQNVSRAAERLHDVINNMLDISRIEQNRLRLKPESIDIVSCLNESIDELKQFFIQRQITCDKKFQSDLPEFYGDKVRIQQVFTNLLSNALKYSPDHSKITIEVYVDQRDIMHLIFEDQGIGLDDSELEKIFEPFYEVANVTRHSTHDAKFMGGGTGLGLSIVRGILKRHGGDIRAESPGVKVNEFLGSTFHVLLPVKSKIEWDDNETQIMNLNQILGSSLQKKAQNIKINHDEKPMILIIDGDDEVVDISKMALEKTFDILAVPNGEDGLYHAFNRKIDLILIDRSLPGLDGCQICRILKSQQETKHIPVVFFSAATQDDEIEECYASGATEFLVKPFSRQELYEMAKRLIFDRKITSGYDIK